MTLISIDELAPAKPDGTNATIRFDNGPLYPLTISDPFSDAEEQQLEWYFEKHLEYPFKDHIKAQQCAARDVHGALLSYEDYNVHQEEAQVNPHVFKDTSRYGRPPIEQYEGKKAFLAMEDVEDDGADLVEASELASLLITRFDS